jgi:sulfite exporter TauE/SafE
MLVTFSGCLLGLLLGVRHALEPDHLAAVSTLVADARNPFRGAILGAAWGIGHSVSLLGVGLVLSLFRAELPASLAKLFELGVCVMLVVLGVRAIARARRSSPAHQHPHDHPHDHPHERGDGADRFATRSLFLGVVHGLAGSGAITALVIANLSTTAERLFYIALFGFGSIVGMMMLSGVAGWPLARLARRPRAAFALLVVTGGISTVFGLTLGTQLLLA